MNNIDPKPFVFDSPAAINRSRVEREYMRENAHLALQFPIESLRANNPSAENRYFHPIYPGRVCLVVAQSRGFKTEWVNFWSKTAAVELGEKMEKGRKRGVIIKISTEDAIESLVESEIASFGGGKLDDIVVGDIKNPEAFIKAEVAVGGLPIVHIGESLGMDDSNAALLTLTNIGKLIEYVNKDHFGQETPIAAIFLDYLQTLPFDRDMSVGRNMSDSRTLQINRDMDTFRRMTKYFSCAGVVAAQSSPDDQLSTINRSIKIPGFFDVHWSKYPPQRCEMMYALWMPKTHYKIGEWVDESSSAKVPSKWNFQVKNNGLWIQCHKQKKYTNSGASFPLQIAENNNVELDVELYERIVRMERGY